MASCCLEFRKWGGRKCILLLTIFVVFFFLVMNWLLMTFRNTLLPDQLSSTSQKSPPLSFISSEYLDLPPYFERYQTTKNVHHLFEDYEIFHRMQLSNLKSRCIPSNEIRNLGGPIRINQDRSSDKYLIFKPWETSGLANVIIGLCSSFLLSILSGRVFLVNWPGHYSCRASISDLFQNPSPNFNWNYMDLSEHLSRHCPENLKQFQNPSLFLEITHRFQESDFTFGLLKCKNFANIFDDYGHTIQISSNQYFAPLLYQNPIFATLIKSMFPYEKDPSVFNVFGPIFRYLFKPIPQLNNKIERLVKMNGLLEPNLKIYGIQIRRNEYEKNGNWFRENHEQDFWRCLEENFLSRDRIPHKIIVVSDNRTTIEHAQKHFGEERVIIHSDSILDFSRSKNAVQSALIDAWLLSYAKDGFVVSKFSTFGNLGHGRADATPFVVTKYANGNIQCVKSHSPEPEFHWGFRSNDIHCDQWNGGTLGYPARK